jgi:hypothetical protein
MKDFFNKITSGWVNIVFALFGLVAIIILGLNIVESFDLILILNKIYKAGLLLGLFTIYKMFFASKEFDNDTKISENPIAVALDSGLLILALAIAIAD